MIADCYWSLNIKCFGNIDLFAFLHADCFQNFNSTTNFQCAIVAYGIPSVVADFATLHIERSVRADIYRGLEISSFCITRNLAACKHGERAAFDLDTFAVDISLPIATNKSVSIKCHIASQIITIGLSHVNTAFSTTSDFQILNGYWHCGLDV